MSVIEEVRKKRKVLALAMRDSPGIRRMVEDLYPDSAHFIYELLQNAEDRRATQVRFTLSAHKLRFEHNGETFTPENIYAITDIGSGTKAEDDDTIGRFGIGFKAVFAYSETPRIWSPTYSFEISELVLPSGLNTPADLNGHTRFDFPFNNPKKSPDEAFLEIRAGLKELAETTLLFLRHINSIKWKITDEGAGEILRIQHEGPHLEILSQFEGHDPSSLHFLKFEQPVIGLPKQRVAAAFPLDYLPSTATFDRSKALREQLKIVPAAPGHVSIFFPAAKESSGLRFHVHAPFVAELSRASVKETPANEPLFDQLAALTARSLSQIRDLGLLNTDFLGVLPALEDQLGPPYERIRVAVIEAMNNQALTPTHQKTHAPAKSLYQAPAGLKDLLSPEDLQILIGPDGSSESCEGENRDLPQWAAGAMRNTNAERFMSGLSITDWGISNFVKRVYELARWRPDKVANANWLGQKPPAWHQRFYALLHRNSDAPYVSLVREYSRIVRRSDGSYSTGKECCFPDESLNSNLNIPVVDSSVYTTGKNEQQQNDARQFLMSAGVTEIGERQLIKAILNQYYSYPSTTKTPTKTAKAANLKHMKRFIALHREDPNSANLFQAHRFFLGEDEEWHDPEEIFLDQPYIETGLKSYYQALETDEDLEDFGLDDMDWEIVALSNSYLASRINPGDIVQFAKAVGAHVSLQIESTTCRNNPQATYLYSAEGTRWRDTGIDQDFVFPNFERITKTPSLTISKVIWNTMMAMDDEGDLRSDKALQARFRLNRAGGSHYAPSQLVVQLTNTAWVPQGDQFVKPADAIAEDLPKGFKYDAGADWLNAINFGQNLALRSARAKEEASRLAQERARRERAAHELGFIDIETAERARRLAEVPPDIADKVLAEYQRTLLRELPEQAAHNPERRSKAVSAEAAEAPEKHSVERMRSVPVGQTRVKEEAKQYLEHQYTSDGEMFCQACRSAMPFKLDNGDYYFEAEPLFLNLKRMHGQNHLALCPNHAAMFRYALGSRDSLQDRIAALQVNEFNITLAGEETTLHFTKNHITDLQAILQAEKEPKSQEDSDNGE